jgi:hypothetical protein
VTGAELDRWLSDPVIRTHHRREAAASPSRLWEAAGTVRLDDSRLLGRLVAWRIPGAPAGVTYREMFHSDPFTLLEEGDEHSLSGLCGRIWTRREFTVLPDPAQFPTWSVPGTVRVLFAHWAVPAAGDRAALVSEVRIAAADRQARLGLRLVRPLIAAFEYLIASEPLAIAVRRAES